MTEPPAEVRVEADGTETLVWRREYPDPPHDLWAAITESDRLGRWIGTWTGECRVGGAVAFVMTGEVDAGGEVGEPVEVTVRACEPPRHLAVTMPEGERSWYVDLTVEPAGGRRSGAELDPETGGSTLVFAQRLVEGVRREHVEAGWSWYLDRLTAVLRGTPMPDWADYA